MSYYHQTPIMKRILEFIDESVYIKATDPNPDVDKRFRRYNDIIDAMGDGVDLHRSNLDFKRSILMIDLEYGNQNYPGEIFHNPLGSFQKLEPTRAAVKNMLDENNVSYIETMTGQGYNFTMGVPRNSQTYASLLKVGEQMRVLPESAAKRLQHKQSRYGNVPLIEDHIVSTAFGRINDYIFDSIRDTPGLIMRTTDLFDNPEIAIFDSTQHAYLLSRRAFRTVFSLHQKSRMHPKYNYHGPAIVTLPVDGIPLEDRIQIRQDERNSYARAVDIARNSTGEIPNTDLTNLITNYLFSNTAKKHLEFAEKLGFSDSEFTLPFLKANSMNWDIPPMPDWSLIGGLNIDPKLWDVFAHPNDEMLKPTNIRHIIGELSSKGVADTEIISLLAQKYNENHGWTVDVTKTDPILKAEYWVRTLKEQL